MKYLLDTNILISGLLFEGNERKLLRLGRNKTVQLFVSNYILQEFQDVLLKKFSFRQNDVELAISYILESVAEIIVVQNEDFQKYESENRDKKDVHVIVASKKIKTTIVTGDEDLFDKETGVAVIKCNELLNLFDET